MPSSFLPGRRRAAAPAGATVPYDFAASFEIQGEHGRLVQDVVSIGPDADFVAVGVSYGFEEDCRLPAGLADAQPAPREIGQIRLGELPPHALVDGVRVDPRFERLVFTGVNEDTGIANRSRLALSRTPVPVTLLNPAGTANDPRVLQRLKPAAEISFLFSLLDTSTGRELQDQPVHNIAGLGAADGDRPFRLLPKPLTFGRSSTLRFQIVERTPGVKGRLFIVLIGYKVLRECRPAPPPASGWRSVSFDYVARLELEGVPRRVVEAEVPICIDGGFTATSIGYGLETTEAGVPLPPIVPIEGSPVEASLAGTFLRDLPPSALVDGFRVRRDSIRFAFQNATSLAPSVPLQLADRILERVNTPASVMFRYAFFDDARGIELQNVPINSVAGLGNALGERPFRQLARPLHFLPRSTFRLRVEEVLGRGTLFIVLQGYRHAPARGRA